MMIPTAKRFFKPTKLTLLLCVWLCGNSRAETLKILERHVPDRDFEISNVLQTATDTFMFTTESGLYRWSKISGVNQQILHRYSADEDVPFSVCHTERLNRLITPFGLWEVRSHEGNRILFYEEFCGRLYAYTRDDGESCYLKKLEKRQEDDYYDDIQIQQGVVLYVLWDSKDEKSIALEWLNSGKYRRLFRCPPKLAQWRDSIGLSHTPFCKPAFNPLDSTLWLAIEGYNYIYVVDVSGELRDSVAITLPDYRMAPKKRSRMKSDAVVDEWNAQWTYITGFSYVPPGYFLMQYVVRGESCKGAKVPCLKTALWDTKGKLIPLDVDPRWAINGVRDDGKIIFIAPEPDSLPYRNTILIGRIEP